MNIQECSHCGSRFDTDYEGTLCASCLEHFCADHGVNENGLCTACVKAEKEQQ